MYICIDCSDIYGSLLPPEDLWNVSTAIKQ